MATETSIHRSPEMSQISRVLRATRRVLRTTWTATGAALTLGALTLAVAAVALTDLAMPLPTWARLIGLLVVLLPTLWLLVHGVVRPLVRKLSPQGIARRVELHLPGMHNRLLSCVDLAHGQTPKLYSPAFLQRLLSEAVERLRPFRPSTVIDRGSLQRAGSFACVGIVGLLLCYAIFPDRLPTAVARIFSPFADIPPASGVLYEVAPGDTRVLRGDDLIFSAVVMKGQPEPLRLEILPEGGSKALWHELVQDAREPQQWTFRLSGADRSFSYRVHGGGTWSRLYQVRVLDRPRIAAAQVTLHYPAYLGFESQVRSVDVMDVAGPVGSEIEVRVAVAGDANRGEVQLLRPEMRTVAVTDRRERFWFRDALPKGASSEGNWQWDEQADGGPTHSNPAAPGGVGSHGFQKASTAFQIRKGEVLFADVFLPEDAAPEQLMIQLHDANNWERRVYWGADKIGWGQPDTVSRRSLGSLPEAGRWVRLEIPASSIELEGRTISGVSFAHFGGKVLWRGFGALPPATREVREFVVENRFPLDQVAAGIEPIVDQAETLNHWTGHFPLFKDGWYRLELRNELNASNPPMKEAKLTAIPDLPPSVSLERPGGDVVVSEPIKVPLFIAAQDDFALADLVLSVQKNEAEGFRGRPVKRYEEVTRSDAAAVMIDLAAEGLTAGQELRYRVEARDRAGQSAQSRDYVIRIAPGDGNALDKKLDQWEQQQESVQEKLAKLVADQQSVHAQIDQLEAKYEPLIEKMEAAKAEAQQAADAAQATEQADSNPPEIKLDEAAQQELAQLRAEINALAQQEKQNVEQAKQAAAELSKLAEQAAESAMLPTPLTEQLQNLADAFPEAAVSPLEALSEQMLKSAAADQNDPALPQLAAQASDAQRSLEAVQARLDALAQAQQQSRVDPDQAMANLRSELARQEAALTMQDLAELRDALGEMRSDFQQLQQDQEQLLDFTPTVPELLVEDLQKKQQVLDQRTDQAIAEAQRMLGDEKWAPLKPAGSDDNASPADAGDDTSAAEQSQRGQPPLLPALGGPPPRLDPRLAQKLEPLKQLAQNDSQTSERRGLQQQQAQRLQDVNLAEQSLASDQQTVQQLLDDLAAASLPLAPAEASVQSDSASADTASQTADSGESGDSSAAANSAEEAAQNVLRLLQSSQVQDALAMAARLHGRNENQADAADQRQSQTVQPSRPLANHLSPTADSQVLVQLDKLDPAARAVILQMQPKLREELLQSLREEGPEGYQAFIRDYFRRLTQPQKK